MIPGEIATVEALGSTVSAWLNPYGDWYYTGECGHAEAAEAILSARGVDLTYGDPVEMLEDRGWVHISYGEIIFTSRNLSTSVEGAISEAVSYIVRNGMVNGYQRSFVRNAAYII